MSNLIIIFFNSFSAISSTSFSSEFNYTLLYSVGVPVLFYLFIYTMIVVHLGDLLALFYRDLFIYFDVILRLPKHISRELHR